MTKYWYCGSDPPKFVRDHVISVYAPLKPTMCYSTSDSPSGDEDARFWQSEEECSCMPSPAAPPPSPRLPTKIYFCGQPGARPRRTLRRILRRPCAPSAREPRKATDKGPVPARERVADRGQRAGPQL